MKNNDVFSRVLHSFEAYYDINVDNVCSPFIAEAEFHSHAEQYFLVKAAKLAEVDSNEYVYFALEDNLDLPRLHELKEKAWTTGLSKVKPFSGHKNSDIALIILAENVTEDVFNTINKIKLHKSYYFSFYGWSNFRLVILETSSSRLAYNKAGRNFKEVFQNIKK
ncbi:MAG: hypothetical protein K6F69_05360 [Treponema sp.]|nr:hypothetical protein [Treponema sp.]